MMVGFVMRWLIWNFIQQFITKQLREKETLRNNPL